MDVVVVSQLSIRISLSKDSLRRADDPGSPNDIDFLRFPPDPEVGDPKGMEGFDGRTFVQDGGRLRWQEPDGTQQVLNRRFWC